MSAHWQCLALTFLVWGTYFFALCVYHAISILLSMLLSYPLFGRLLAPTPLANFFVKKVGQKNFLMYFDFSLCQFAVQYPISRLCDLDINKLPDQAFVPGEIDNDIAACARSQNAVLIGFALNKNSDRLPDQ